MSLEQSPDSQKVHEVAAIFCYHKLCDVTLRNLESLKKHNPGMPVILVSNGGEVMQDSLNTRNLLKAKWKDYGPIAPFLKLRHLGYLWHLLKNGVPREYFWRNADMPLYLAYDATRQNISAKRYVFLEWDCYCNVDLSEFYKEVWDADLAAQHVIDSAKEPNWDHFDAKYSRDCPPKGQECLYGIAPLAAILLSDQALEAICRELKDDTSWRLTFCELRVATIAKYLNLNIQQLPEYKRKFLRAAPPCWDFSEVNEPAVWHMVKN